MLDEQVTSDAQQQEEEVSTQNETILVVDDVDVASDSNAAEQQPQQHQQQEIDESTTPTPTIASADTTTHLTEEAVLLEEPVITSNQPPAAQEEHSNEINSLVEQQQQEQRQETIHEKTDASVTSLAVTEEEISTVNSQEEEQEVNGNEKAAEEEATIESNVNEEQQQQIDNTILEKSVEEKGIDDFVDEHVEEQYDDVASATTTYLFKDSDEKNSAPIPPPSQKIYFTVEKNRILASQSTIATITPNALSFFHQEQERIVNGEWQVLQREVNYRRAENVEFFREMEEDDTDDAVTERVISFDGQQNSSGSFSESYLPTRSSVDESESPEVAVTGTMSSGRSSMSEQAASPPPTSTLTSIGKKSYGSRFRSLFKSAPESPTKQEDHPSHLTTSHSNISTITTTTSSPAIIATSNVNNGTRTDSFFDKLQKLKSQEPTSSRRDSRSYFNTVSELADKGISTIELKDVPPLTLDLPKRKEMYLKDETRLLSVHDPKYNFVPKEQSMCHRNTSPDAIEPYATNHNYYLFNCKSIDFKNGLWEPLFCSIYLYDIKARQRVSSSYQFCVSSSSDLKMLDSQVREQFEKLQTENADKNAIFSLKEPNPYLYLIVWIDRVFQGNLKKAYKVYQKGGKEQERMKKEVKEQVKIASHFREPFIFGYTALFKTARKLVWDEEIGAEKSVVKVVPQTDFTVNFFKSQGVRDVQEYLESFGHLPVEDVQTTNTGSRFNPTDIQKILDRRKKEKDQTLEWVFMKFEFTPVTEENVSQVIPEITNVTNRFELAHELSSRFFVADVLPNLFTESSLDTGANHTYIEYPSTPAMTIRNTVYLYPESLDIHSMYQRSYTIQTYVRNDDKMSTTPIKCLKNPYNSAVLDPYSLTSITYYSTSPQLFDEVDIELPVLNSTSKCHLFFEVFHISSQKASSKPHELGYAMLDCAGVSYLRLFNDEGNLISDGLHTVPIYPKLSVEDYLDESDSSKPINNAYLTVRIKNASTVHFQDSNLTVCMQLLSSIISSTDSQLFGLLYASERDFNRFKDCHFVQALQHVPAIMNSLFSALTRLCKAQAADSLQEQVLARTKVQVFESLLYVLHGISSAEGKYGRENKALSTYIQWFFKENSSRSIILDLLPLWTNSLNSKELGYSRKYTDKLEKNKTSVQKVWTPVQDYTGVKTTSLKNSLTTTFSTRKLSPRKSPHDGVSQDTTKIRPLDSVEFAWFFFDLIIKSLATAGDNTSTLVDQVKNEFSKLLAKICPILVSCTEKKSDKPLITGVARKCNLDMALFMRDLLQFESISSITQLLCQYNELLQPENESDSFAKVFLRLEFYDLFMEYPGLVAEILPKSEQEKVPEVVKYFIASVVGAIEYDSAEICHKAVQFFRQHLTRLDYDSFLDQNRGLKHAAISAYIQFVDLMTSNLTSLKLIQDLNVVLDIILCIYYILSNTSYEKASHWIKKNNKRDAFLEILLITNTISRSYSRKQDLVNMMAVYPKLFKSLICDLFLEDEAKLYRQETINMLNQAKNHYNSSASITEEEVVAKLGESMKSLATEERSKKESFSVLFDKCSYFNASLLLLRAKADASTFIGLVTDYVYPFIRDYSCFYGLSRVLHSLKEENIDLHLQSTQALYEVADAWRLILGALLFVTPMPLNNADPSLQACLKQLLSVYDVDENGTVVANNDEEDTDISSEMGSEISSVTADDVSTKTLIVPEGFFNYNTPEEKHMFHGVTLRVLVRKLLEPIRDYKPDFYQCFFLMYFTVATSRQVLTEIHVALKTIKKEVEEKIENEQDANIIKQLERQNQMKFIHLLNAVRTWISQYFAEMDNMFLASLIPFIYSTLPECVPAKTIQASDIQKVLHKRLMYIDETAKTRQSNKTNKMEPSIIPSKFKLNLDILEWDALEIAKQITLIDSAYFRNIKPSELVARKKTYDAPDVETRMATAYNVTMLGEQWKKLGMWAVSLVLKQTDLSARRDTIKKLFEVCKKLREIRNYNACYALSTALNHSAIFPKRLKETWSTLHNIQHELDLSGSNPFGRETLKQESEKYLFMISRDILPCVPLIPELKGDLARAKEHPKYIANRIGPMNDKLINFDRIRNLTWIIDKVQRQQKATYNYVPIPLFTRYFSHLEDQLALLNDQDANDLSHRLEQ